MPRKNLALVGGVPLIVRTIRQAKACTAIDEVVVSTEDAEIATVSLAEGIVVRLRPTNLADDFATSESAILDVLNDRVARGLKDPSEVVFLQCTSPIRADDDIQNALEHFRRGGFDSLLSATDSKRFLWEATDGNPRSINYDYNHRKREQDCPQQWQENGSIYIFKPEILRATNNRLGGKIGIYEMDFWSSFQVDSEEDLQLCDWLARKADAKRMARRLSDVRALVLDFDGVLTDNRVLVDQYGKESVTCDRSDGMGIELLRKAGVKVAVLSKEQNPVVSARCEKLRIECLQGLENKLAALNDVASRWQVPLSAIAYVGNDVNDIACLDGVRFPFVPSDAHPALLGRHYTVLKKSGGNGAVRELCDSILTDTGSDSRKSG